MRYGNFDVYIDTVPSGSLKIEKSGLLTCFECSAHSDTDAVLRLAGDTGERYEIIGVMMPSDNGLHLEKYFTKNDLYIKKLDEIQKYVLIENGTEYPAKEKLPDASPSPDELFSDFREFEDKSAEILEDTVESPSEEPAVSWSVCRTPELLFNDSEAGNAVSLCSGVLTAEKDGFTYVAVPVDPKKPFPAIPIFYFGNQGTFNGREYLVFRLKDGQVQI